MDEVKNSSKKNKISPTMVLGIIILFVLLIIAGTSCYVVDATEQSVVTRFG